MKREKEKKVRITRQKTEENYVMKERGKRKKEKER